MVDGKHVACVLTVCVSISSIRICQLVSKYSTQTQLSSMGARVQILTVHSLAPPADWRWLPGIDLRLVFQCWCAYRHRRLRERQVAKMSRCRQYKWSEWAAQLSFLIDLRWVQRNKCCSRVMSHIVFGRDQQTNCHFILQKGWMKFARELRALACRKHMYILQVLAREVRRRQEGKLATTDVPSVLEMVEGFQAMLHFTRPGLYSTRTDQIGRFDTNGHAGCRNAIEDSPFPCFPS